MQVLSKYLGFHHIDHFLLAVLRSDAGTTNATTATRGIYASANGSPGATTSTARVDTATAIFAAATHFVARSAYGIWLQQSLCAQLGHSADWTNSIASAAAAAAIFPPCP